MSANTLSKSRDQVILQIAILALLLLGLIHYKGAAGIRRIQQARATGALHLAALPSGGDAANRTSLSSAEAYLRIVWPALVFGILISAALRTSLSRTPLHIIFNGGTAHDEFAATMAGVPLMLCSCCAARCFRRCTKQHDK